MRPPDLPGGNAGFTGTPRRAGGASMRPPDLPGGNMAFMPVMLAEGEVLQ